MKKTYQLPTMHIVTLHHAQMLCTSGEAKTVESNVGIDDNITGGTGAARAKESVNVWDKEW